MISDNLKLISDVFVKLSQAKNIMEERELIMGDRVEQYNPTVKPLINISRTLVSNKIVDNSDVVGALPVGAAPTTSSFST